MIKVFPFSFEILRMKRVFDTLVKSCQGAQVSNCLPIRRRRSLKSHNLPSQLRAAGFCSGENSGNGREDANLARRVARPSPRRLKKCLAPCRSGRVNAQSRSVKRKLVTFVKYCCGLAYMQFPRPTLILQRIPVSPLIHELFTAKKKLTG